MRTATMALGALALTTVLSMHARAQAAQSWSVLASPFLTAQQFTNSTVAGLGAEVQARYSVPGVSVGLGFQFSNHSSGNQTMKITGIFIEPRYAPDIGSDRFVPYLSGRLAALRQTSNFATGSNGYAVGAGGGVMVKLSRTINLDLGGAVVRQSFGNVTLTGGNAATFTPFFGYVAKIGLSFGL